MKWNNYISLVIVLLCILPVTAQNYSRIVFQVGTHLEMQTGTNITVDSVTMNGTFSGNGTINGGPIPVELVSFNASIVDNKVTLKWLTATELNNYRFEIERRVASNQSAAGSWGKIGFVQGQGTSTSSKDYLFVDANSLVGKNSYRLKQIDFGGKYEYSKIVEVVLETPLSFKLSQNFPNPFNPTTKINYELPQNSFVSLKIFDALGREVRTLVNQQEVAGYHEVSFSADNLSSGVYFYSISAGAVDGNKSPNSGFRSLKKMILMK